jgi:hypothetical protein
MRAKMAMRMMRMMRGVMGLCSFAGVVEEVGGDFVEGDVATIEPGAGDVFAALQAMAKGGLEDGGGALDEIRVAIFVGPGDDLGVGQVIYWGELVGGGAWWEEAEYIGVCHWLFFVQG